MTLNALLTDLTSTAKNVRDEAENFARGGLDSHASLYAEAAGLVDLAALTIKRAIAVLEANDEADSPEPDDSQPFIFWSPDALEMATDEQKDAIRRISNWKGVLGIDVEADKAHGALRFKLQGRDPKKDRICGGVIVMNGYIVA